MHATSGETIPRNRAASISEADPIVVHKLLLAPDGAVSMPYATSSIVNIFGIAREEVLENFSPAWARIHTDDRSEILRTLKESARTMQPMRCELRVDNPDSGERRIICCATPEHEADGSIVWFGYLHDITPPKSPEKKNLDYLRYLENMDRVNQGIQGTESLEQMMQEVLDVLLSIFDCDRAYLVYPCDPDADSCHIPMERTRPEYPGGASATVDLSVHADVAAQMQLCLQCSEPIAFGGGVENPPVSDFARSYQVKSLLCTALYPKIGKPWMFGLHQCSHSRTWADEDKRLFSEVAVRISEGLTNLLATRDLRESDERFRQAFEFAGIGMGILSIDGCWLRANQSICEMLGYSAEQLRTMTYQDLTHPDDLVRGKEDVRRVIAGEISHMQIEKRYRHRDGHYIWAKLTTSVVRDERGKPLYFVSQIEDIDQRKQAEQEIHLLSFAINRVHEAAFLMDENAFFKYVNDEACRQLGYSRDELLSGMSVPDIDPDYQMPLWRDHWMGIKKHGSALIETIHRSKTGTIYPVEVSANYFEFDGRGYNLAIVRNITERKLAERARLAVESSLRESDERFRQMPENSDEVVWLTDVETGKRLYVNPAYQTIWGQSCESLYANPDQWRESLHPDDRNLVEQTVLHGRDIGEYEIEYRIIRSDGCVRHIHERAFPIRNEAGRLYRITGTARDVTAQKEQEARIQYLAYHDAVTGLPNRSLVLEHLRLAIAQAHRQDQMLAVLFLDLDRFKTINDTLGHCAGDELLKQAGACWAGALREEDTVGRFGGDEFLVILPRLETAEDAAHVAGKLFDCLSRPFDVANREIHVSTSVGISIYPRDADNAETLVKYADTALYLAKEQGRNTFRFFSPELDIQVHQRLRLENELRSALDKNQLYLVYQPLVELRSGRFVGVEALLRWRHPVYGLISPADFIPVAEETGQIFPIGKWVLRTACTQARAWLDTGIVAFRMSINLSRRQLEQAGLTEDLQRILDETGCPAECLELEITESASMSDPEQAIVKLNALHQMGIRLALDDYGTGYSCLAYLKRFPLDHLKIDRSFVKGIPTDRDDETIVQATIVMARQLGLKVVAEGVETEAQRAFLSAFGCDEIQGFLCAEPMYAEDVVKRWIK